MIWEDRMRLVASALAALALVLQFGQPAEAGFPDHGLRIVVPFPAGGSNDVVARLLGSKLQQILGQPVVIDNRAGAGGNIGADGVARSPADGYTLLLTAPGPLAVNQSLYAQLSFNPERDFTPVALIASVPIVLAVNPNVEAKTVAELVALAKASPGKLNFGSSGLGSTNHLAGELLKARAGINIVHVPYRGAAPAMNDLIAGEIPMMFDNMPAIRPQVAGGTIRAIAVAGSARSPLFPELPTMAEAGVAGFEASSWFGLVGPAKMPPDVTKSLIDAVAKALADPDIVKRLADVGAEPGKLSGDAFGAFLRDQSKKWGEVVKTANAKVE
jgi:tripartite-type tricarboxylate transporter receptor subunit TctC